MNHSLYKLSQQFSSLMSLKFYYLTRRSVRYHHDGNVDKKAFFFLLGTILVIPFLGMFLKNGYKHGVDTNKHLETPHMIDLNLYTFISPTRRNFIGIGEYTPADKVL